MPYCVFVLIHPLTFLHSLQVKRLTWSSGIHLHVHGGVYNNTVHTVLYSFYVKTICQLTCLSGCNEEEQLESKLLNGDAILCVPFEISFFTFL
ncbi:Uncharacterized protein APZ42_026915 [Daphnia magna]|uniref:Secreted protein n=1 Tax=Daphnia magna TaxID=35525 RepID=A0A164RVS2_9CRUS|nr:Uncharacterized protein APZ42_026915 [Daphnia magna]